MQVLEQDEEYEEEYEDDEEFDYDEEGEEDTDADAGLDTIYGIPKQYVIIGGVVILLVIIGVFVFSNWKKQKAEEIYVPEEDPELTEVGDTSYDDFVDATEPESPTYEDGQLDGYGFAWDAETGDWITEDEWNAKHGEPTITDVSTEDMILLRKMGYTGDEIEYCIENGFSVEALVEAAQALYDEEAAAALERMSDHASEEFRYIIDRTYFSQPGFAFEPQMALPTEEANFYPGSFTVNADYTKCPTYGNQLQLKCKVADDCYVWYVIEPKRWEELPEAGNIVLHCDYSVYGSVAYITDVYEVDPTLETINAEAEASIGENIETTSYGKIEAAQVVNPADYQDATVLGEDANAEVEEEEVLENEEEVLEDEDEDVAEPTDEEQQKNVE